MDKKRQAKRDIFTKLAVKLFSKGVLFIPTYGFDFVRLLERRGLIVYLREGARGMGRVIIIAFTFFLIGYRDWRFEWPYKQQRQVQESRKRASLACRTGFYVEAGR